MTFVVSKRAKEHSKRSPESKVMAKTVKGVVLFLVLVSVGISGPVEISGLSWAEFPVRDKFPVRGAEFPVRVRNVRPGRDFGGNMRLKSPNRRGNQWNLAMGTQRKVDQQV